jgi:3',5'-cyclic AMP phosphodiesterase CpdA
MKNLFLIFAFCITLTSCNTETPEQQAIKHKLSFAFLTDIHQNARNSHDRRNGFVAAVERVKQTDAQFIVTGGDMVDVSGMGGRMARTVADSLYAANKKILDDSGLKYYPAIGNHDRFFDASLGFTEGDELFKTYFEKSYYTFAEQGVKFFVLNSVEFTDSVDLIVGKTQMEWLKSELAATDSITPLVMVLHVPIYSIYYPVVTGRFTNQDMVANFVEIRDAFKGHNLKLVLQGHQHIYEEIYSQGVWYITAGAVCANWWRGEYYGTKYGFLLVHVDTDNNFSWEYINLDWTNE